MNALESARASARGVGGVIDLHAHAVLEAGFGVAGKFGPELAVDSDGVSYFRIGEFRMKPMAYRGTVFMDVQRRLEQMEMLGIALQMLSPNPLTMFHHIDAPTALRYCQVHNDAMAELVARHPGKLLGAAALPMQDVDIALVELERCIDQLGLVAPYTGTHYPFGLDDARLDDFYRTLVAYDVPLFLHPASSGGAQLPDDARMGRFDMSVALGYAYEETIAVATLVLGGVLDRHPRLDVCVSHGGGAMPYLYPRFQKMAALRAWAPESVRASGFQAVLQRVWFDAHVEGAASMQMLVNTVGTGRLVFGTNFGGWDTPAQLEDLAGSLTDNARRLLRLA